ncbi:MAG: DUF6062 family protein [Lachnospiraceae bacterium]|nr:DUF6062 family protein [Lachnospiraceae bacterium]
MKEQLFTIPVNDAFRTDCECPVCKLYEDLEKESIEFVMGPSYMEDDIRMETDEIGFCSHHVQKMYHYQNRLGLALMLHTHMKRTNERIELLAKQGAASQKGLFHKNTSDALADYLEKLEHSCYVCNRMNRIFDRYIETVLYCYEKDDSFRDTFQQGKGFCTHHYAMLRSAACKKWSGSKLDRFIADLDRLYLDNMKRVTDDLEWFTDKFDYRNENAPWKNSKDALPRSIIKTDHTFVE